MFEDYLLEVMVSLASGSLAFRYTEKFLYLKAGQRKRALALWLALYVAGLGLWGQAGGEFHAPGPAEAFMAAWRISWREHCL